jgi:hypothetical protein
LSNTLNESQMPSLIAPRHEIDSRVLNLSRRAIGQCSIECNAPHISRQPAGLSSRLAISHGSQMREFVPTMNFIGNGENAKVAREHGAEAH